ncbi:MAG: TolC family protein [Campylobacterota bacterium]|nr:TolC family protein [Campylobacterota bacterium]
MKLIYLLLLITFLKADDLSFSQAWQMLQSSDYSLKQKSIAIERKKDMKDATTSLYLPQITFNAEYAYIDKPVSLDLLDLNPMRDITTELSALGVHLDDSEFTTDLSKQHILTSTIDLKWALFTGFKREAVVDIAKYEVLEAVSQKELEKDKLFFELVELYYGVVMLEELHVTLQSIENSAKQHYENAKLMLKEGQVAKIEVLSAKVLYADATTATKKIYYDLKSARDALNIVLKDDIEGLTSKIFMKDVINAFGSYQSKMLQNSQALKAVNSKIEQAESNVRLKEGSYYPEVFAFGNKFLYKDNSIMMGFVPDWSVGVGVKFDIVDVSGRSSQVQAANKLLLEASSFRSSIKEDLLMACNKIYNDTLSDIDEYNNLLSTIELAKENYKLRADGFKNGMQTSNDVNDALSLLSQAMSKRNLVSYSFIKNYSMLLILSSSIDDFEGLRL